MDGACSVRDLLGLFLCKLGAQQGVVMHLHLDRSGHVFDNVGCFLFLVSEEWVEKFGLSNVLPQLAVFKKHMHGFPERVVENLDDFLMNEWVLCDRPKRVPAMGTG